MSAVYLFQYTEHEAEQENPERVFLFNDRKNELINAAEKTFPFSNLSLSKV